MPCGCTIYVCLDVFGVSGSSVWASDDRKGTSVARSPDAPPVAEDIYKLLLLDQEDEQSVKDQQQSGGQVSQFGSSITGKVFACHDMAACSEWFD